MCTAFYLSDQPNMPARSWLGSSETIVVNDALAEAR
jgi:hypothetical protein